MSREARGEEIRTQDLDELGVEATKGREGVRMRGPSCTANRGITTVAQRFVRCGLANVIIVPPRIGRVPDRQPFHRSAPAAYRRVTAHLTSVCFSDSSGQTTENRDPVGRSRAARAGEAPAADEQAGTQDRLGARRRDADEQSGASTIKTGISHFGARRI